MTNDDIIARIIEREGGLSNHVADRGGLTNYGITMPILRRFLGREATVADMRGLTVERATRIYRQFFVMVPGFDRIENDRLREQVIDAGVLHNTRWAARRLQECAGVTADGIVGPVTTAAVNRAHGLGKAFLRRRVHRIGRIVQGDLSQAVFLVGWLKRALEFLET